MTMKLLYDTQTQTLLPWPRIDDEPVVGLAAHLLEMTVVQEDQPAFDPASQRLDKTEVIDTDNRTVTRGWNIIEVPPPVYTAEDHLKAVGIGGERQPTLLYLRQSLAAAGKQCEELDALEGYLQMILAMFAANQSPRSDWPVPSVGFEQAVAAAVSTLQA